MTPAARRLLALACTLAIGAPLGAAAPPRTRIAKPTQQRRPIRPAPPAVLVPPDASASDLRVSEACQRGLGRAGGAVVALDPASGRVITIVNPAYALARAYQPCSVIKIVTAIAGLSEGAITPDSVYTCEGGCWLWPGHGPIDLRRALGSSCNPYFQWVGAKVGFAKLQHYARLLGLGSPTGINLDGETAGFYPSRLPQSGIPLLSSHAQGITTSALQLAVLLAATVNGGAVFQPQLAAAQGFVAKERWRLPPGTVTASLAPGFLAAVNEGSAADAFDPDIIVAGKTGTCAGVGWFASYAPADRPEIVIVVFLRPGNGHYASTVAGRIYQNLYKSPAVPSVAAAGR